MNERIIVFAPHPDDETYGCGGTMIKRINEGYEVMVVVITDGRHSFLKMLGVDSNPTPEEVKEIRKDEVKRATKILGIPEHNLIFLDLMDGTLENHEDEAEEKVTTILSRNLPVEVYIPYRKDYNPDHRAANRIVRNSIRKSGIYPATYQYSITQKYARFGPIIDAFFNLVRQNIASVDISEFLPLKEAAIKEFKSDLAIISRRHQNPIKSNMKKFLKNKETFYID